MCVCVCVRACVCVSFGLEWVAGWEWVCSSVCFGLLGQRGYDGGSCSVSCVRVCSKGYFFEEILSMELYLFKTF